MASVLLRCKQQECLHRNRTICSLRERPSPQAFFTDVWVSTMNSLQPNTGRPFISLDDITLRVGDTRVFERTSWALKSGQHWAVIGPNGSGKSLLADAICRRVPLVRGQIRFFFDGAGGDARSYPEPGEILRISAKARQQLLRRFAGYYQARWQSIEGEDVPTVAELLRRPNQFGLVRTPTVREERMQSNYWGFLTSWIAKSFMYRTEKSARS